MTEQTNTTPTQLQAQPDTGTLIKMRFRWLKRIVVLAAVGIALFSAFIAYCMYEASTLQVEEFALPLPPANPQGGELRILHVTDFHGNEKMMARVVAEARKLQPDVILFTGDLITGYARMTRTIHIIEPLRELAAIAPTLAVYGNHDMEQLAAVERILTQADVTILRNQSTSLLIQRLNRSFHFVGLGEHWEGDLHPDLAFADIKPEDKDNTIAMVHAPITYPKLTKYPWRLLLAGHTHGGQIVIPWLNYKPLRLEGPFDEGFLLLENNQGMFVSRGVGGGPRLNCPPTINLLRLPL